MLKKGIHLKKSQEEALRKYKDMIEHCPRLKRSEEQECIKLAQQGNKEARDRLLCANLKIATYHAKYFIKDDIDIEDLIQEGVIGLIQAINEFDLEKNIAFSSFARWKVKGNMANYLRKNGLIVYPGHIADMEAKMCHLLQKSNMTEEQLQQYFEITDQEWELVKQKHRENISWHTLDQKETDYDPIEQVDQKVYLEQLHLAVTNILNTLADSDYRLIKSRFFESSKIKPYRDIAKEFHVSSSLCHKKEKKLLLKLQRNKKLQYFNKDL